MSSNTRDIQIYLPFDLHDGQLECFLSPARFRVLDCGRKFGKTTSALAEIARAVGSSQRVAYMAPTYSMLMEMWRSTKVLLGPIIVDKSEQEHRIETVNGSVLKFWSLDNPDGPRSDEYDLIIVDEAALIDLLEVWEAVLWPTLMKRHGRALFMSTPRGFDGFYELWKRGQPLAAGGLSREKDWASWQKPTWVNPHINPSEVEEMRRTYSAQRFSEEIEAKFLSGAGAVFRYLDQATVAALQANPILGHAYVVGADLAKSDDFSVFVVIDVTLMAVVWIDRSNHIDYSLQRERFVALCNRYRVVAAVVEQNTNLAFMETLVDTGLPIIPFTTGAQTKPALIEALAGAFDNHRLTIPNDADLLDELRAFRMERLPSGQMRYGGPRMGHDDIVMALALSYHAATYGASPWKAEVVEIGSANEPETDWMGFPQVDKSLGVDQLVQWPVPSWLLNE